MARTDATERKRQARLQRQLVNAQRRRLAELDAERRAEEIAPSHVRHAVTDAGGRVVRGAMVNLQQLFCPLQPQISHCGYSPLQLKIYLTPLYLQIQLVQSS